MSDATNEALLGMIRETLGSEGLALVIGEGIRLGEALDAIERDVEAMEMLRRLQADAGWSGWFLAEDFVLEPCYVGGDRDPADAIRFASEMARFRETRHGTGQEYDNATSEG